MFISNKYIILILVLVLILVLIGSFNTNTNTNTNRTIETYNNVLNPYTYNSNNNTKFCAKINNDDIILPLAYNDFCNSLKDQSNNYLTPDEHNKYCVTDLLLIPKQASTPIIPTILTAPTTTAPTTATTTLKIG